MPVSGLADGFVGVPRSLLVGAAWFGPGGSHGLEAAGRHQMSLAMTRTVYLGHHPGSGVPLWLALSPQRDCYCVGTLPSVVGDGDMHSR